MALAMSVPSGSASRPLYVVSRGDRRGQLHLGEHAPVTGVDLRQPVAVDQVEIAVAQGAQDAGVIPLAGRGGVDQLRLPDGLERLRVHPRHERPGAALVAVGAPVDEQPVRAEVDGVVRGRIDGGRGPHLHRVGAGERAAEPGLREQVGAGRVVVLEGQQRRVPGRVRVLRERDPSHLRRAACGARTPADRGPPPALSRARDSSGSTCKGHRVGPPAWHRVAGLPGLGGLGARTGVTAQAAR